MKPGHMVGNCLNFIIQVQKFGGTSRKKSGGQKQAKFRSILYNLRLWSRLSPERLKISKIGKRIFQIDSFCVLQKRSGERWSTSCWELVVRNEPLKCTFLANYISAIRGCCALKFLDALQIGQSLLAHIRTERRVPPKHFNPENLKFTLKFSVWAPITSGLMGVYSQNFFQMMCLESGVIKSV